MASNNQGQGSRRRGDDILSFLDNPTVILKGPRNYPLWSRTIEAELKKRHIEWILDLNVKVPQVNKGGNEWKATDKSVLSWIRRSVSKEVDDIVGTSWTTDPASKVWKTLKELYSQPIGVIIVDIREEIYSLRQETQTLNQYSNKFVELWTELKEVEDNGNNAREDEKLVWFLRGLGERFSKTRSQMKQQNPMPSFDEAVARLIQEDQ